MSENLQTKVSPDASGMDNHNAQVGLASTSNNANRNSASRATRQLTRNGTFQTSTNKDFEGSTPKLGGILALHNENVTQKTNYDCFLEKLGIYIVNDIKNGDHIVEVTKNSKLKIIEDFMASNKPTELSDDSKNPLRIWKYTRKRSSGTSRT